MVGFEAIQLMGDFWYSLVGNPIIMAVILIFFIIMALAIWRVPLALISFVLIPVIIGFVLNARGTNFLEVSSWIIIPVFLIAGFLMWLFWLLLIK